MNLVLFLFANSGQPLSMQRLSKTLGIRAWRRRRATSSTYRMPIAVRGPSSAHLTRDAWSPEQVLRRRHRPAKRKLAAGPPDLGRRLENAVFLALRRRGDQVTYASEKDSWECDFVTDTDAIQVCAQLGEENLERELRGALRAAALPGDAGLSSSPWTSAIASRPGARASRFAPSGIG